MDFLPKGAPLVGPQFLHQSPADTVRVGPQGYPTVSVGQRCFVLSSASLSRDLCMSVSFLHLVVPARLLWNRQRHLGRGLFSPFGGFRARLSRSEHLDGTRFPSNWTRTVRDVGEDVFMLWHVVPPVGRRPSRLHDATASRLSNQRRGRRRLCALPWQPCWLPWI